MGERAAAGGRHPQHQGRLRRALSRWSDDETPEAGDRRRAETGPDQTSIDEAPDRELVTLRGTLNSVTVRPRGGVPALEAELVDSSGALTLVWLGRRRIAGIDAGRAMRVTGRVGRHGQDQTRILYNPRYELLS